MKREGWVWGWQGEWEAGDISLSGGEDNTYLCDSEQFYHIQFKIYRKLRDYKILLEIMHTEVKREDKIQQFFHTTLRSWHTC